MRAECFLDTNILVYAASSSGSEAPKRARAIKLIQEADFGLSAQVLQEFYVTVTRKFERPLSPQAATALMEAYRVFPTVPTDYPLIVAAVELSLRHRISYWDAAVIAAAEALRATVIYTEDLNHGQLYGSVRAVNPFVRS